MTLTVENHPPKLPWYEDPDELKRVRKKLGLSQSELATRADVTREIIANIEAGRRSLSGDVRHALWEALSRYSMECKELMPMKLLLGNSYRSTEGAEVRRDVLVPMKHALTLAEDVAELRTRNGELEARAITAEAQVAQLREALAEQTILTRELSQKIDELSDLVNKKLGKLHKAIDTDVKNG